MRNLDAFESGSFYHIYNRTNNRELLFHKPKDYVRFLNQFFFRLSNYALFYSFALIPNHFHFLCYIKEPEEITSCLKKIPKLSRTKTQGKFIKGEISLEDLVLQEFSNFFNCYTRTSNLLWNRKGNLFHRAFKRKRIKNEVHLKAVIRYINTNAEKHGIVEDFRNYTWSSFEEILLRYDERIESKEVLAIFGGKEQYLQFHLKQADEEEAEWLDEEE